MFNSWKIRRLWSQNRGKQCDEMYKSRLFFTFQAATGGVIYNLTTGAFMAGFATLLGASDSYNGYLAIIPVVAGIAQVFSPLLLEPLVKRKPILLFFVGLYNLLISTAVFIPLVVSNPLIRLVLLFVFVSFAYICNNLAIPGLANWLISVVPERKRGRYFGIKDSFALVIITAVSLTMGFVLDSFKRAGESNPQYEGFLWVFSVPLILSFLNIFFLVKAKEQILTPQESKLKLKDCVVKPLTDKKYMKVVFFSVLWNIGFSFAAAFIPVYMVRYLLLDYKYIMFLGLISSFCTFVSLRYWGKFADRTSWVRSTFYSIGLLSVCHFVWFLITTSTLYLLPLAFLIGGIAWGGIGISLFNLPFMFMPSENKTLYLGFNAFLGGASGLIATLIGGQIVSWLDGWKLKLDFFSIGSIQMIIFLSSMSLVACVFYIKKNLWKL